MYNKGFFVIEIFVTTLFILIPLIIVIAFYTLIERKLMASIQRRRGPNINGYSGLLQPIIDGLKLILKEIIIPAKSNMYIFILAPIFMMSLSFALWSILPFYSSITLIDTQFNLLFFLTISSLNVYNVILSGWSSNSKYAFLGSIRAISQMLSYELILGLLILLILSITGSLRIFDIVNYQIQNISFFFPLLPIAVITFITLLAETNRIPFDLPEAESELVAGYNVEYSSITFTMFFLSEYCNMVAMSTLWVLLFWSGWGKLGIIYFILKILFICLFFIFVRALLPRYRFDQLILIGWQVFLPFTFSIFCFILGFLLLINGLLLPNFIIFL
mgnify:CR=1 FL=1|jgi:NADH:ubiquinone oxidoreductase subunit 1 (chain H)